MKIAFSVAVLVVSSLAASAQSSRTSHVGEHLISTYRNLNVHEDPVPKDPYRVFIPGRTEAVLGPPYVWMSGRIEKVIPQGVIIAGGYQAGTGGPGFSGGFVLINFPYQIGTINPSDSYWGKDVGVRNIPPYGLMHVVDYGTLPGQLQAVVVAPVKLTEAQRAQLVERVENKKAAQMAKALKFNLDAAEKGDAYGEYRMGQRYRDGEGVEKDLTKARAWFAKAAAQGHPAASNELASLPPL